MTILIYRTGSGFPTPCSRARIPEGDLRRGVAAVPVEVLAGLCEPLHWQEGRQDGCVMHAKNARAHLCAGVAYLPGIDEKQCTGTVHILRAVDEPR
jgi:hypothetical protein